TVAENEGQSDSESCELSMLSVQRKTLREVEEPIIAEVLVLHSVIHKDSSHDRRTLPMKVRAEQHFVYNRKANHIIHSQNGNTT
ncbi:hypothetical protein A2U01_0039639, partial [Trifolium medium]|nr:hypothetical protein [Trifolium medium]